MYSKIILTALSALSISALASAQDYVCVAKANPNRGFNSGFEIHVSPAAVGGKMVLSAGGQQKVIGTVSQVATLDKNSPSQKPAFDLTLGLIAETDVSGVPSSNLNKISAVKIMKVMTADGDEFSTFQLMNGSTQIGGTFMGSGLGTACMP
jgi:hypothetical protein